MPLPMGAFIYYQYKPLPSVSSFGRPLTGRTVLLTGGNVGLGLEAAKHLASLGPARLIITSRSASKGAAAVKEIQAAGEGKVGKVECWEIDQSKFSSIQAFADRFAKEGGGKLDLLVLNAAVAQSVYEVTPDGWETQIQVNHLSTVLLALRLLPFLLAAKSTQPGPRIVIVNSGLHYLFDDLPEADVKGQSMLRLLSSKEHCTKEKMAQRYSLTKLLNVFTTKSLAEHIPPSSSVGVQTVDPGFCRSQLARNLRTWGFWLQTQLLARTTEAGSRTLVHAAVSKELDGRTGEYCNSCFVGVPSPFVLGQKGKEIRDRLWTETIDELSKVDPEVPKIVKQYLV